jgi:hypothetical protein
MTVIGQRLSDVALQPNVVGGQLVAAFTGPEIKRARRLRGGQTTVIPFCKIDEKWSAWLGYREVWSYLDKKSGTARYSFTSSDLTLFLEFGDSEDFQQIVRAEWSGLQRNDALVWDFQPSDAGHPHWQVDVAEFVKQDAELVAARALLLETEPQEFGASEGAALIEPCWYRLGRIHFASAMRPWQDQTIAHGPSDLAAIRAWAVRAVALLGTELARL